MLFDAPLPQLIFAFTLWLVGQAVLYLVIRLAVRHALEDADRRRELESQLPTAPPDAAR